MSSLGFITIRYKDSSDKLVLWFTSFKLLAIRVYVFDVKNILEQNPSHASTVAVQSSDSATSMRVGLRIMAVHRYVYTQYYKHYIVHCAVLSGDSHRSVLYPGDHCHGHTFQHRSEQSLQILVALY